MQYPIAEAYNRGLLHACRRKPDELQAVNETITKLTSCGAARIRSHSPLPGPQLCRFRAEDTLRCSQWAGCHVCAKRNAETACARCRPSCSDRSPPLASNFRQSVQQRPVIHAASAFFLPNDLNSSVIEIFRLNIGGTAPWPPGIAQLEK